MIVNYIIAMAKIIIKWHVIKFQTLVCQSWIYILEFVSIVFVDALGVSDIRCISP